MPHFYVHHDPVCADHICTCACMGFLEICNPGWNLSKGLTSAFVGGIFGVSKKCPVLLPQFCRQKSPGLPSTSSTPLQQLESGDQMWLLPKHSLLLLLSTHSVENNPNSSSENLWPYRLIFYEKKVLPRKKRVDQWSGATTLRNSDPGCICWD